MTTPGPKRVLVLWADSESTNLGVQALAEGSKQLIMKAFPDCEVMYLSYSTEIDESLRPGAKNLLLASVGVKRRLSGWLASFDLVLDTGAGDSFSDIYGARRLIEMSVLRLLVRRANVPFVMGPQTIGPFNSKLGRLMARLSVRGADVVLARDSAGFNNSSDVYSGPTFHTCDVAFLIPQEAVAERSGVLLNVSGLLWNENPHVDSRFYRRQVENFARMAIDSGLKVTLLAHVLKSNNSDSDSLAVRELQKILGGMIDCYEPKDLYEVRSMIAQSEVVVASRMHASLNALSQGIPTVSWGYSDKFRPLLDDLKWTQYHDLREKRPRTAECTLEAIRDLTIMSDSAHHARQIAFDSFEPAVAALREVGNR